MSSPKALGAIPLLRLLRPRSVLPGEGRVAPPLRRELLDETQDGALQAA